MAHAVRKIFRVPKLNIFFFLFCLTSVFVLYCFGYWSVTVSPRKYQGKDRYHVVISTNLFGQPPDQQQVKSVTNIPTLIRTDLKNITATEALPDIVPLVASSSSYVAIPAPRIHRYYSCNKLIRNDKAEQMKVIGNPVNKVFTFPDEDYLLLTKDCDAFLKQRAYTRYALSQDEADFPIAYSIMIYKDIEQFERLLRSIYRPQNYYCIHVDSDSPPVVHQAAKAIASCFDNVFLTDYSIKVRWGYFSILEPELLCMKQLMKYKKWKYFINLTGQEFPLKTNGELVKILTALNGANNMEGSAARRNPSRVVYVHHGIVPTKQRKTECPLPIKFTKGSVHIVAQRGFVDYVLHDYRARIFQAWVNDTGVPDETFFSSLNYNPQLEVPGSYRGKAETDKIDTIPPATPRNPFIARFKNWGDGPFNWPCKGKRVRQVCIFGVGDLPLLSTRKELFANKFYTDFQPQTYECLEELHYNKTRQELRLGKANIDVSFYEKLHIVQSHIAGNIIKDIPH